MVGREQLNENGLIDLEEAFYQSDFETTEEIITKIREVHRSEKDFREDANGLAREILERILTGSEGVLQTNPILHLCYLSHRSQWIKLPHLQN